MKFRFDAQAVDALRSLEQLIAQAKNGDTIEVTGIIPTPRHFQLSRPVNLCFAPNSGFMLGDNGYITIRDPGWPLATFSDPAIEPADEGQSYVICSAKEAQNVNMGSWIFLHSRDALQGLTPHVAGWVQSPGECHQVAHVESIDTGRVKLHLRETLRDAMLIEPRFNLRNTSGWCNLRFDGATIWGMGSRTMDRCLVATDTPGLRLDVTTISAGAILLNAPDVNVFADIKGQAKPRAHYGIVMGAPSSNFYARVFGYGCRHVVDTVGAYPLNYPTHTSEVPFNVGTPWGMFDVVVKGEYHAPVSTHACGNGIIVRGKAECVRTYDAKELAANHGPDTQVCLIRARNTDLSALYVRGSGLPGSIGVYSTARGTRLPLASMTHVTKNILP